MYVYLLLQHLTTLRPDPYGQLTAFIALRSINLLVWLVDVEFFCVKYNLHYCT
jgi:hypothetical protein